MGDGRGNTRPKLEAQPTVFFDILAENDATKRREIIGTLQKGSPTTGEVVNILQSLAGDDYIEKSHLELLKKLGEGGFAVVEKALLSVPGKEPEVVAIKTLKPGLIKDEEDLHELIQEANVLRKLKHRYIVNFKGIGCLNTTSISLMRSSVFFGEEYMPGGSLKGMVVHQMRSRSVQVYKAEDAWRWCLQMAEALDYLHHCKPAVVHRDLKPENVLLTSRDVPTAEARIADFGLHKRINRVRKARVESVRTLNASRPSLPTNSKKEASVLFHTIAPDGEKEQNARQDTEGNTAAPGDDTRKKVRWQDQKDADSEANQPTTTIQDHEDTTVASSTQPGVSIGESFSLTGRACLPQKADHALLSRGSLQSVPEDGPISLEDASSSSSSICSLSMESRSGRVELLPIIVSTPVVTALDTSGEPPEHTPYEDHQPAESDGRELSAPSSFGTKRKSMLKQVISEWESGVQANQGEADVNISSSPLDLSTSSLEHRVHGGPLGLLQQKAACLSSSGVNTETLPPELSGTPSCRISPRDLETNRESGLGGIGDGIGDEGILGEGSSSGADMELLVSSAAQRSDGLNDVAPNDDADNSVPGKVGSRDVDAKSAAPVPGHGSSSKKKGFLVNAVDSIKVARKQKHREPLRSRQEDIQEGQQRGSSRALDTLDSEDHAEEKNVCSDVPDAYSSVMYSLGLSGSGHLSGMVGSLMYMAPEVVKGQQYTEKVFLGRLMIAQVLAGAFSPRQMEADLQKHAKKVAFGHRHAVPSEWPRDLRALICACWNQDPKMRPAMAEVITRLQDLKKNGVIKQMEQLFLDELGSRASQWRCCTIS